MKSMRGLRVVVVIDSEHGHILAARLRRMEVAQVTAVAISKKRGFCVSRATLMPVLWPSTLRSLMRCQRKKAIPPAGGAASLH